MTLLYFCLSQRSPIWVCLFVCEFVCVSVCLCVCQQDTALVISDWAYQLEELINFWW